MTVALIAHANNAYPVPFAGTIRLGIKSLSQPPLLNPSDGLTDVMEPTRYDKTL